jgi:predicted nucleic acid-binding protein
VANQYVKPYFESSVFIAWIKGTETFKRDGSSCKTVVDHIIKLAEQGVFRIVTSTWTLAEVHKRKKEIPLPEKQCKKLLAYFENDYIDLVDVTRAIGEQAHMLARLHGLTPTDSVHLACALRAKCDILLSYDPDFLDVSPKPKGIVIDHPKIIHEIHHPLYDGVPS